MDAVKPYAKAVVAFIAPAAVVLSGAVLEGSVGGTAVTTGEVITALCAAVITSAGAYAIPNIPDGTGKRRAK